jgi:hypothetical protein
MPEVPTSIRIALGIAATAADELRKVPERLPAAAAAVPMIALSATLQASMRIQQQLAVFASRGDEVLAHLRGSSDEAPEWATFDDDSTVAGPLAAFDGVAAPAEDELAEPIETGVVAEAIGEALEAEAIAEAVGEALEAEAIAEAIEEAIEAEAVAEAIEEAIEAEAIAEAIEAEEIAEGLAVAEALIADMAAAGDAADTDDEAADPPPTDPTNDQ